MKKILLKTIIILVFVFAILCPYKGHRYSGYKTQVPTDTLHRGTIVLPYEFEFKQENDFIIIVNKNNGDIVAEELCEGICVYSDCCIYDKEVRYNNVHNIDITYIQELEVLKGDSAYVCRNKDMQYVLCLDIYTEKDIGTYKIYFLVSKNYNDDRLINQLFESYSFGGIYGYHKTASDIISMSLIILFVIFYLISYVKDIYVYWKKHKVAKKT